MQRTVGPARYFRAAALKAELRAAAFFLAEDTVTSISPLGEGNINDTFTVTLRSGESRILQRLNPSVFPQPQAVMHNMRTVIDHLRQELGKISAGSETFRVLSLYPGRSGDWYEAEDGSAWRMMSMLGDSISCSSVSDPGQARELGSGLGFFHRLLSSLDPEKLYDTLPEIHNTSKYLNAYDNILSRLKQPADPTEEFCSSFIEQRRQRMLVPEDRVAELTSGIIHGDPKVDNFLFDKKTRRVTSLIDFDTIKPGLLLHDLGDALRSCCNSAGETAVTPENIFFDHVLFHAWLTGYFTQARSMLNSRDLERIVDFVRLITFELGLRFYTDYLDGSRYFKVHFPEENVQRALIQFYLVESIEKQHDHLQSLVCKAAGSCCQQQNNI